MTLGYLLFVSLKPYLIFSLTAYFFHYASRTLTALMSRRLRFNCINALETLLNRVACLVESRPVLVMRFPSVC
ncbi:hypothetical protein V1521DRAFT_425035 [Lipomyces starkeyi]